MQTTTPERPSLEDLLRTFNLLVEDRTFLQESREYLEYQVKRQAERAGRPAQAVYK